MQLRIHVGLKTNHVSWRVPWCLWVKYVSQVQLQWTHHFRTYILEFVGNSMHPILYKDTGRGILDMKSFDFLLRGHSLMYLIDRATFNIKYSAMMDWRPCIPHYPWPSITFSINIPSVICLFTLLPYPCGKTRAKRQFLSLIRGSVFVIVLVTLTG